MWPRIHPVGKAWFFHVGRPKIRMPAPKLGTGRSAATRRANATNAHKVNSRLCWESTPFVTTLSFANLPNPFALCPKAMIQRDTIMKIGRLNF